MTVTASPVLHVAELTVPGGLVAGARPSVVAVDQVRLTWGRAGVLDQPTPARVHLTILDTSPGRTFARRTDVDLIGQIVTLGWTSPDIPAGATMFRGRITDAAATRYTSPDGSSVGALVELDASSIEVDAANYVLPESGAVWPAETFTARLARIMARLPPALVAGAELPPGWTSTTAAGMDVEGADVLSLLRKLYDSTGAPMLYDPARNVFTWAPRRYVPAGAAGGNTNYSSMLKLVGGKYVATCDVPGITGSAMDARRFVGVPEVASDMGSQLTRVAVNYTAAGNTAAAEVAIATTPDESVLGRRVFTVDSNHNDATGAGQCASAWASLVVAEASAAKLAPVVFSTARTPFADAAERAALLTGVESATWWFLRGSWPAAVGVTPWRGITGATIAYAGGEWTVQPVFTAAVNENYPPGLRGGHAASSAAVLARDIDPSVTFADCAFLNIGAGFTAATMPFLN